MKRRHLLAAEVYAYSYAHYQDRLGNPRFSRLMPQDMDVLEKAELGGWPLKRLAKALECSEDEAEHARQAFQRAREVVDAPNPAESFRRGVRQSIEYALEKGLRTPEEVEALVVQVCYRAADLGFLLDQEGSTLSDYSRLLRREPGVDYGDLDEDDD